MPKLFNPAAVVKGKFPTNLFEDNSARRCNPADLRGGDRRARIIAYLTELNVTDITLCAAIRKQHHRTVDPELWVKTDTASIMLSIDYFEFKVKDLKISPRIAPPERALSLKEIDTLIKSGGRSIESVTPPKPAEKVHSLSRPVHVLSPASLLPPKEAEPEPEPTKTPLTDGVPASSIPVIADLLVGDFGISDIKTAVEVVCNGEPSQGQLQQVIRRLKEGGHITIAKKGAGHYSKVTTVIIPAAEVTHRVVAEPTKPVPAERVAEIVSEVAQEVKQISGVRSKNLLDLFSIRESLRREKEVIDRKQALLAKITQRTGAMDDIRTKLEALNKQLADYQEGLDEDIAELKSLGLEL